MKTRTIGRTGLAVTEFSFGTASLGGLYRACPREAAMATLDAAWDEGLRYVDTAPWYGFGLAERYTGDFLREKPKGSYVLSTKVGRVMVPVPADAVTWTSPESSRSPTWSPRRSTSSRPRRSSLFLT